MKRSEVHVRVTPARDLPRPPGDPLLWPGEGFWALAGAVLHGVAAPAALPWRWFWAAQHRPPAFAEWVGYELRLALAPEAPARLTFWVAVFAPDDVQADLMAEERLRWALAALPQGWQGRWLNREETALARRETPPFVGVVSREPEGRHGAPLTQADARPPFPDPWRPSPPGKRWAALLAEPDEPLWLSLTAAPTVLWPAEVGQLRAWGQSEGPCPDPVAARWRAWQRRHTRPFLARLRVGARSAGTLAWGLQALVAALTWPMPVQAWARIPQDERRQSLARANWQWGTLHPWEAIAGQQRFPYLFAADELAHLTTLLTGALP